MRRFGQAMAMKAKQFGTKLKERWEREQVTSESIDWKMTYQFDMSSTENCWSVTVAVYPRGGRKDLKLSWLKGFQTVVITTDAMGPVHQFNSEYLSQPEYMRWFIQRCPHSLFDNQQYGAILYSH